MATVIDRLQVILGIKTEGFQGVRSGVKSLTQGIQRDISHLTTAVAGLFTVAAGKELVVSVTHMAERWKDVSEQTGLSLDKVQKYDAYLKTVGLTIEDLQSAFDILGDKRKDALEKGGASMRTFQSFGITEDQLASGMSNDELFALLNPDNRQGFGELFGNKRAGKFAAGARSIQEGGGVPVASDTAIKELDDASKAFERASLNFKVSAIPLAAALVGFGTKAMDVLSGKNPALVAKEGDDSEFIGTWLEKITRPEYKKARKVPKSRRDAAQGSGYDEAVAAAMGVPGGRAEANTGFTRNSVELSTQRTKLQEAAYGVVFKYSSGAQQKGLLDKQIAEKVAQAKEEEGKGNFDKADSLRAESIKLAGERAGMDRNQYKPEQQDQLASHGLYVGGAAAMNDPKLQVEQDIRSAVQSILDKLNAGNPPIRDLVR